MKDFCKGVVFGVLVGTCVGAIIVVKNKKLSNKLKVGLDATEDKLKETKQAIEEKLTQEMCGCKNQDGSCENETESAINDSDENKSQNNNFSKKNKNC